MLARNRSLKSAIERLGIIILSVTIIAQWGIIAKAPLPLIGILIPSICVTAFVVLKVHVRWIVLGLVILSGFQADLPLYVRGFDPLGSTAFGRILSVDIGIALYVWRRWATRRFSMTGIGHGRIWRLQITSLLMALILWEFFSLSVAQYVDVAFFQVLSSVRVFAVMLIVIDFARDEQEIEWVVRSIVVAYSINVAFAGLQLLNGGPLGLSPLGETQSNFRANIEVGGQIDRVYVSGFVGGPYSLAGYLVMTLPLLFSLLLASRFLPRWLSSLLLGWGLLLLMMTGSRGAMIALICGITAMIAVLILRGRHRLWIRSLVTAGAILVPVVIIFGERIYLRLFVSNTLDSADTRFQLLESAIGLFSRNPVLGVGIANFSPIVAGTDTLFGASGRPVHNVEFLWLAETGLVGALLLVGCWAWAIVTSVKVTGSIMPVTHFRFLALGLFGGIIGAIVHGQSDIVFRQAVIFMQYGTYLGLLGSLVLFARNRRKTQNTGHIYTVNQNSTLQIS